MNVDEFFKVSINTISSLFTNLPFNTLPPQQVPPPKHDPTKHQPTTTHLGKRKSDHHHPLQSPDRKSSYLTNSHPSLTLDSL